MGLETSSRMTASTAKAPSARRLFQLNQTNDGVANSLNRATVCLCKALYISDGKVSADLARHPPRLLSASLTPFSRIPDAPESRHSFGEGARPVLAARERRESVDWRAARLGRPGQGNGQTGVSHEP